MVASMIAASRVVQRVRREHDHGLRNRGRCLKPGSGIMSSVYFSRVVESLEVGFV